MNGSLDHVERTILEKKWLPTCKCIDSRRRRPGTPKQAYGEVPSQRYAVCVFSFVSFLCKGEYVGGEMDGGGGLKLFTVCT